MVEVIVPQLRRVPPGEVGRVFTLDPDHVGIETFDDLVGQVAWSHHWIEVGGRLVRHSAPYRYVWPSELDLMARILARRGTRGSRRSLRTVVAQAGNTVARSFAAPAGSVRARTVRSAQVATIRPTAISRNRSTYAF